MLGIVITPGRPATVVDKDWTMDELQEAVGGFIEALPNPWGDTVVYVNEDGKAHGLAVNEPLSHHLAITLDGDQVLGTAVVLGVDLATGECRSVDPLLIDLLAREESVKALIERLQRENEMTALQFGIAVAISDKKGVEAMAQMLEQMSEDLLTLWGTVTTEEDAMVTGAVEATLTTLMGILKGGPWMPPRLKVETEEVPS